MATDTWESYQRHWSPRKCWLKPQWGTTSDLPGWSASKWRKITSVGENLEKSELSHTTDGNEAREATAGNSMWAAEGIKRRATTLSQQSHIRACIERRRNQCFKTCLHSSVLTAVLFTIAKTWKVSISGWAGREKSTYYYSAIKEGNPATYDNMDEPGGH